MTSPPQLRTDARTDLLIEGGHRPENRIAGEQDMSSFVLRILLFAMLAMVASAQTPPAIESGDQLETGDTEAAGYTLTPDGNPDGAHSLTQQDVRDGKVQVLHRQGCG